MLSNRGITAERSNNTQSVFPCFKMLDASLYERDLQEEYVQIKESELQSILSQLDQMKKKL